jgi:hypothetical protein
MKSDKKFERFINVTIKEGDKETVNWMKRKEYWLSSISKLYSAIKTRWLHDYIKQNKIVVRQEEITLQEDFFGTYQTNQIIITIGSRILILKPIGGIISGAYGRIDIKGTKGTINLILNESAQWEYKVKTPFVEYIILDKHAFLEIIEELM